MQVTGPQGVKAPEEGPLLLRPPSGEGGHAGLAASGRVRLAEPEDVWIGLRSMCLAGQQGQRLHHVLVCGGCCVDDVGLGVRVRPVLAPLLVDVDEEGQSRDCEESPEETSQHMRSL